MLAVGLAVASVDSARRIADASAHEQQVAEGTGDPGWLDAARRRGRDAARHRRPALDRDRADDLLEPLDRRRRPPPPGDDAVPARSRARSSIGDDGVLRTRDGAPLERPLVVAPTTLTLAGEKVAERPAGTSETPGLVAWRPDGDVRAVLRTDGFLPNGDFTGTRDGHGLRRAGQGRST